MVQVTFQYVYLLYMLKYVNFHFKPFSNKTNCSCLFQLPTAYLTMFKMIHVFRNVSILKSVTPISTRIVADYMSEFYFKL